MSLNRTSHGMDSSIEDISRSAFGRSLADFAISFLCWPSRRSRMNPEDASVGLRAWSSEAIERLSKSFAEYFQTLRSNWTREDIDLSWRLCLRNCDSLVDWYRLVIGCLGIAIRFHSDEPEVLSECAENWHFIIDRLDPDSLVAFLFSEARDQSVERSKSWPLTTRVGEHDLNVILERGISDLHVHLGGIRSAHILWRRLLHEPYKLDVVPRYSPRNLEKLLPDERSLVSAERDDIKRIVEDSLTNSTSPLRPFWQPVRMDRRDLSGCILAEVRVERRLLIGAWRHLIQGVLPSGTTPNLNKLELEFDRYLSTKNSFLRHHWQPERTNPGLAAFRRHYWSTDLESPRGRHRRSAFTQSPGVKLRELSEYAAYVAQSRSLKRLELRLAPLGSIPYAYHRFFETWKKVEDYFGLAQDGREIKFAVHFKRSLGANRDPAQQLHGFLAAIDRDTAVLHAYRWKADHPWNKSGHIDRIARIDFAGQERDLPVQLSSFYMNLLRGDQATLKKLSDSNIDATLHRFWLLHYNRRMASQPAGRQRLGITCHAGEDYAHPLEGIFSVASAVELLKMESGDTIGHGLALGVDIDKFNVDRAPVRLTRRGSQFDALLWLLLHLQAHEQETDGSLLSRLRGWVVAEAKHLYGDHASTLIIPEELDGLAAARAGPLHRSLPYGATLVEQLRYAECKDKGCVKRRADPTPIADIVQDASSAIRRTQSRILKMLLDRGIILEFNPSSNLRVSGSGDVADTPFVAIINLLKSQCLATINTDNPGVFATRIENEYALLLQALEKAGFDRVGRLEIADRIRRIGVEFVWWPKRTLRPPRERSDPHDIF